MNRNKIAEEYVKPVKPYACVADNIGHLEIIHKNITHTLSTPLPWEDGDCEFYVSTENTDFVEGSFINTTHFNVTGHPDFSVQTDVDATSPDAAFYDLNLIIRCGYTKLFENKFEKLVGKPTEFDVSKFRFDSDERHYETVHQFIHRMQHDINWGWLKVQDGKGENA